MRAYVKRDPKCTRMAFFLGTTLHSLGRWEEALDAFQARIDLGGWYLERFECHLRRVRSPSSYSTFFNFLVLLVGAWRQCSRPASTLAAGTSSALSATCAGFNFPPLPHLFPFFGVLLLGGWIQCFSTHRRLCLSPTACLGASCAGIDSLPISHCSLLTRLGSRLGQHVHVQPPTLLCARRTVPE